MMDNVKALLLFLVAFGHTLDVYKGSGGVELYIMKYIYLFHMPLFAFITGYFTKNFERARETAVEKCLMPYLIFQGLYVIMANVMIHIGLASFNSDVFNSSILIPSSAFYYLLAVFFWKIFAKDIMRVKYPLLLSVFLGVIISLTKMDVFHVGYGAVFSLLPFFVLGVICDSECISKIRRLPKWGGSDCYGSGNYSCGISSICDTQCKNDLCERGIWEYRRYYISIDILRYSSYYGSSDHLPDAGERNRHQ